MALNKPLPVGVIECCFCGKRGEEPLTGWLLFGRGSRKDPCAMTPHAHLCYECKTNPGHQFRETRTTA